MENRILISYIVPCYNIEAFLPRCLESLSKQHINSGHEVEFVLVNDGSPDNCLEILREFAEKDRRGVVIDQKNQGVSAARNTGLRAAKGQYVFFLDGDDYLTDDASQILYDVISEYGGDIIVTNAYYVKEGAWDNKIEWNPCGKTASGLYNPMVLANVIQMLPISFKVFRHSLLIQNDIYFDEKLRVGEVFAFFIHAFTCSSGIVITDKRIMNYTVRKDSVMRTVNIERDSTIILTMHSIDDTVKEKMPQLKGFYSYNCALFRIVNMFGLNHYVMRVPYSKEVGIILYKIIKDKVYRGLQKFFLFKKAGFTRETAYSLFLYIIPIPILYRMLRLIWKMKLKKGIEY